MIIEKISFLNSFTERLIFWTILSIIFIITLSFKYIQYLDFQKEEFLKVKVEINNIYEKESYQVLHLKNGNLNFFSSVDKHQNFNILEHYEMIILTANIGFLEYLKGFYTKSMLYTLIPNTSFKSQLHTWISNQHFHPSLERLYQALLLAQPLPSNMRNFFANLGISHLIAISGFHISVVSMCLYFLMMFLYKPLHQYYFPYRNRRFDVLIFVSVLLFFYLILTGYVPSLLRAFIMMIMAFILLRNHIKIFSYETLLLTFGLIIAFFPQYLFSIALWFSIGAVFYIFLFVQYFQNLNKILMLIVFNIWIFLVFNPIVHFFFPNTAYEQLFSPILTLLFTFFYPLVLLLHFLNIGGLLDEIMLSLVHYNINSFEVVTPLWFFIFYIGCSLLSIIRKEAFYLLNILMLGFNFYLFI